MQYLNIRSNKKLNGYFATNDKYSYPGTLVIKDNKISLHLIGNSMLLNNYGKMVKNSNEGYIKGKLENGMNFISKNFNITNYKIHFRGISSTSYEIFSFTQFQKSNVSIYYRNYDKVIVNIDKLSNYLYLPQIFNNDNLGYVIGDIQYKKHIYTISINFNSDPKRNISKLIDTNQRWINFTIQGHFNNWDDYKYILPLSEAIIKFIRLMTRLKVNATNIIRISHHLMTYFIGESPSPKHIKYVARLHPLSYMYNTNNFRHILNNFLNQSSDLHALTSSILTTLFTSNLPIQTILMNLTNGIQIYYSNHEKHTGHSLFHKLEYFITTIPINIYLLIMQTSSGEKFAHNIKDTRDYIVHGTDESNNQGHVLHGVDLPLETNMLKWLIYTKIMLDIGVPNNNVYDELCWYATSNYRKNYIKRNI